MTRPAAVQSATSDPRIDPTALWDQVCTTDPAFVKKITGKSYQGDSPSPYYLARRATEVFGPCGIGWGYDIIDERIEDGALISPGFNERISVARVRVWYLWNGARGEVEHIGGTVFSGKRGNGKVFTDEDAPKKSVTDALVKALSLIGFAGDIFSGRWDDTRYHEAPQQETAEASSPHADDVASYISSALAMIETFNESKALGAWWHDQHGARADLRIDKGTTEYARLHSAVVDKVDELKKGAAK